MNLKAYNIWVSTNNIVSILWVNNEVIFYFIWDVKN